MLASQQIEELICLVATLDRPSLVKQFRTFKANFPIDFTPEFLEQQPVERLRHILLAVCLQSQRLPVINAEPAMAA